MRSASAVLEDAVTGSKTLGTSLLAWSGGIALTAATALWLATMHSPLPALVHTRPDLAAVDASSAEEGRWFGMKLEDSGSARPGVLVREVEPGSPAAEAGIQSGDNIVVIQDQGVTSTRQAAELLGTVPPDGKIAIELIRSDEYLDLMVVVAR